MPTLLQQAIDLAKTGRREEAETLLRQVLAQQPENEIAWLWLSGVTRDETVKQQALTRVLAINPHNALAQKGLALFSSPSAGPASSKPSGPGKPPVSGSPPGAPGSDTAASVDQPDQPPPARTQQTPEISSSPPSEFEGEFDGEASFPWEEPLPWENLPASSAPPGLPAEPVVETPAEPELTWEDETPPSLDFDQAISSPPELTETPETSATFAWDNLPPLDLEPETAFDQVADEITTLPDWNEEPEIAPSGLPQAQSAERVAAVDLDLSQNEPPVRPKGIDVRAIALAKQRQERQQRLLILATLVFIFVVVAIISLIIFDDSVGRYTLLSPPAQIERVVPRPRPNEASVNFKGYPGARARLQWTQADEAPSCDDSDQGLMVSFQAEDSDQLSNRRFCRNGSCAYERELNQQPITTVKVTYICGQDAVITLFKAVE